MSVVEISLQSTARTNATSVCAQSPARLSRYQTLDMWRGLACLLIVVYHSMSDVYWERVDESIRESLIARASLRAVLEMWIGVPMFFVISGYCIAATADSSRRKNHSARTFFFRRFKRIFPPFWICFLGYAVIVAFTEGCSLASGLFRPMDATYWNFGIASLFGNATLTEVWLHHFHGGNARLFIGQSWTLCYEEQFYAVVGCVLFAWPRRFFQTLGAITVAVLAFTLVYDTAPVKGFFFDGQWLLFAAGLLLYCQINYCTRSQSVCLQAILIAGLIWSLFELSGTSAAARQLVWGRIVAFGFALLLYVLHRFDARTASLVLLRPLAFCGTMCYSLYLTHSALVKAVRNALGSLNVGGYLYAVGMPLTCLVSSLVVGWCFYIAVERRFLNTSTRVD